LTKGKKKFLVHSNDSITGGPEALHQFCSIANKYADCKMCYFEKNTNTPDKYHIYNVLKSDYFDDVDTYHVIPEIYTKYFINKVKNGKILIYWLSVDNFFNLKDRSLYSNIKHYFYSLFLKRKPMIFLKKYIHITQSEYANIFLKNHGFEYSFIGDYIAEEFYNIKFNTNKENIICYNPKKGFNKLLPLIKNSKFKFIPIENLNSVEIKNLLLKAKIYIDFGRLPGKDRIPREAILSNCIILLGNRGAALNDKDFAIPNRYKIDLNNSNYIHKAENLIEKSLNNYDENIKLFVNYKLKVLNEKKEFELNIKKFIENI
tara:strand:- start:883 stop:1833 length:951 start_codon:yes stop_codon:yes gene_type:complete